MLARCPSCTKQVNEDADVCPECGWDFIKRQKSGAGKPADAGSPPPPPPQIPPATPKPVAKPPASAAKPPSPAPKLPPAKGAPPPVSGDAGRGLMQFPKIDKGDKGTGGATPDSPFAIPQFGRPKDPEPAPPKLEKMTELEPTKDSPKKDRPEEPARKGPPPAKRLDPTPLAAELEEPPAPEMPKTVVRQKEAPPKPKEPSRATVPPRKTGAPSKTGPMGAYIGLASAAVLTISGVGIYLLTRSVEPRPANRVAATARPFAPGATGATPSLPPPAPPVEAPKPKPQYNPEPELRAEPELPPAPPPKPVAKPQPVKPVEAAPPPPAPKPAPPPPAPKPEPVKPVAASWKFEGFVYDIINLKPVAGAKLVFRSGDKESSCETDRKGRYKISLEAAPTGNYALSISQKAYLDGYVDDTNPPLAELEANERRGVALSNARNDPWVGEVKKTVKRDCYLIPQNLAESAQ